MSERVAVVTGASRGVGRGVAVALAAAGYRVFGTGRSIKSAELPPAIQRIACDHRSDLETASCFAEILRATAGIDVLVNAAWGGYERMVENGAFTWTAPFWDQPMHRWDSMIEGGVRGAFVCSQHAARAMIARGAGLIVNIGFWAAQKHIGNAIYGAAKAATDKLTSDMAHELRAYGVSVVSLYPGLVRTESVLAAARAGAFDLTNSESPEFIGLVVDGLARDPGLLAKSGRVIVAAAAARAFGIRDIDGRSPEPLALAEG